MAENTFTYNFNELILAKQQLKSIIQDGGLEPGEVFAQYPGYIASIIEGGGTSSYLLVTKEELYACGYITAYDVFNMSYATQSYVADYVSTHSGGGSGDLSDYVTYTYLYAYVGDALSDIDVDVDLDDYPTFEDISSMGYITSADIPSVDLSSYVSYSYLESKQYLTEVPNDYPTYTAISEMGYITAADVPEVNLSYVLSTYNLRYINETPFYNGQKLYLLNSGLDVSDTGAIYPESYSYSQIVGYLNNEFSNPWIGGRTMKNYVEGRIAELESSSVTPSYLAANYVSYSYAYNTFVSYAYLGDLEQISEYILGSGSSSAPENVYATKLELGAYVSKDLLSTLGYITAADVDLSSYALKSDLHSYLSVSNWSTGDYDIQLRKTGLTLISTNHTIAPATIAYEYVDNSSYTNAWIGLNTLKNYVEGRIAEIEASYITSADLPVINENIVPKETATYTLGDADHLYARTYTGAIQSASGGLVFRVGNSNTITIGGGDIRPSTDGAQSLGRSSNKWNNAYISNLYADTIHNFIWTGTSAEYAALPNYTTYQIYMIEKDVN